MAQSLELLLIQFLMPDNDARRQAEEQIKRLAKDPQVIPALVHHLRTAKTPNVRQLAAVLLRKKITGHWAKLSPQLRQLVKSSLIESITVEHSPPVRRASANVVSIVAQYAVPAGEWPDLLPFLFQCSQSAQEDHREVALILFSSLTETIGNTFRAHFADLQSLLLKCLQDETSTRVRVAALKAVGSFLEFTHDGSEVRQCLANGEEDVATIAFEIFDELIESPAPLLGESAIQIISWLAKFKSNSLKRHKLVLPILQVMCPLLTEASQEDEADDLAADRAAAEVIDMMAIKLPKLVLPPVFEFASINYQSANPKHREASVTALGVISEGCFELMKDKLGPILHIVLGALKDQEQMVRGAASFALGQFAEHMQPEITSHYESVLPCILNALEDASDEVKSAIGSVATAAEQAFVPYAERVLELMKIFMVLTNDEDLCSRARATELVGIVAMTVGRTRMESILPPFIEAAISVIFFSALSSWMRCNNFLSDPNVSFSQGFELEFSELREYSHGFFSSVAEIMDDSFAKYLPRVVPLAFASCNLDDGSAVDIAESDDDENANGFGGVSSDDDAHDEPRVRNISIRTGVLDEKAAATQAIGLFALHTKSSYAPYPLSVILAARPNCRSVDFRINNLFLVLSSVHDVLASISDTVMDIYIKTMTEDDDKEVVAQACTDVADIIKEFGYLAIEIYMPKLIEATLVLLQEESTCQHTESDSDEDDANHDEVLMDAVSDLLPAFAKSMGPHFGPVFAKLFDPLMKFARASRPPQDRTMVVACLAEVAQEMGAPIATYVDAVMPLVLKELASPEATNRRNAAFCVGELCKNGGEPTLKYYGEILRGLYPMFAESEPDAVRDNAAGAVARMIIVQPNSIPLNQILSLVPELVNLFAQVVVSAAETPEVKGLVGRSFSHLISLYGHQMQPILSNLSPVHANALAAFVPNS
ncbi:hypothetical protein Scep_002712 [Stephania cephalantha]|uniref:Importin N-terminal domain-containing protein n=1 Tax=Stephania cephalantha TaxID=152367 RepID=A0AAP0LAQ6_9MAGN